MTVLHIILCHLPVVPNLLLRQEVDSDVFLQDSKAILAYPSKYFFGKKGKKITGSTELPVWNECRGSLRIPLVMVGEVGFEPTQPLSNEFTVRPV